MKLKKKSIRKRIKKIKRMSTNFDIKIKLNQMIRGKIEEKINQKKIKKTK